METSNKGSPLTRKPKKKVFSRVENSAKDKIRNFLIFLSQIWGSCMNRYSSDKRKVEFCNIGRSKSSG